MKLGAESSKKTLAAGLLFVLALVLFIRMLVGSTGSTPSPSAVASTTAPAPTPNRAKRVTQRRPRQGNKEADSAPLTPSLDPRLHLAQLKDTEQIPYDGNGRNIFMDTEEPKVAEIPKPVAPAIPKTPITPVNEVHLPPPINLKFFGFASGPDHKRVFLAQGDDVMVASEGDIVQRRYKIVKINNNNIEVLDMLSNNRQMIPLTAG